MHLLALSSSSGWPLTTPPVHPSPSTCYLQALQENLRQAAERRTTMANEREGFLRQLAQQAQRNEAAGEVQRKLEGQAARLAAQVERVRAKNAELKVGARDGSLGCRRTRVAVGDSC